MVNKNLLGTAKIHKSHLEYLTKISVKIDRAKISPNLDIEYVNGINEKFFLKNGVEINFVRHSTSLQHRLRPRPPKGYIL